MASDFWSKWVDQGCLYLSWVRLKTEQDWKGRRLLLDTLNLRNLVDNQAAAKDVKDVRRTSKGSEQCPDSLESEEERENQSAVSWKLGKECASTSME